MECPSCLHFNPKNARVCELCERELVQAGKGTSRHAAPGSTGGQPPRSRWLDDDLAGVCQQCGYVNQVGREVCKQCSSPLPPPTSAHRRSSAAAGPIHHLLCPPMDPVVLEAGRKYVLGRGEAADITLPGELVSRKHARLSWRDGAFLLEDMGSSNGTYVNAQRLRQQLQLKDGDSIVIGGFHLRYVLRPGGTLTDTAVVSELAKASTVTIRASTHELAGTAPPLPTAALTGRLEEVAIPEVLQLLHVNRRSGVLAIDGDVGAGGIRVMGGEVVAGWREEGDLQGREALYALVVAEAGSFTFTSEEGWTGVREVMEPTDVVLLQLIGVLRDHQKRKQK